MKTAHQSAGEIDSARVAVLLGISIGLGIAVHEGFFLVAGAIAVGALTVAAVHAIHEHGEHTHLAHSQR